MTHPISLPTLFPEYDKEVQTYQTENGQEIKFKTILGGKAKGQNGKARPDKLRNETLSYLNQPHQLADGEFATVERQYKETGYFDFTSRGDGKIRSNEDVAFIFRQLESEGVEHAFAVYVDREDNPTVQWLSMGGTDGTVIDIRLMIDAVDKLNAQKLFFVHNHPSGNLNPSNADIDVLKNLKQAFDSRNVDVRAIIINLQSGKFAVFNTNKDAHISIAAEPETFYTQGKKVAVYSFSQQAFLRSPQENIINRSLDVAKFLSQQRFASGNKTGWVLLNRKNNIIGNFFQTEPINKNNLKAIARRLGALASRFSGVSIIGYGNEMGIVEYINAIKKELIVQDIMLLDYIVNESSREVNHTYNLYKSLSDDDILREPHRQYSSNEMKNAPDIDSNLNWDYINYERRQAIENAIKKEQNINSNFLTTKTSDMESYTHDYQLVNQMTNEKKKSFFLNDLLDIITERKELQNKYTLERVDNMNNVVTIAEFGHNDSGKFAYTFRDANQNEVDTILELANSENMKFKDVRYTMKSNRWLPEYHKIDGLNTALNWALQENDHYGKQADAIGILDGATYSAATFKKEGDEQFLIIGKMTDTFEQDTIKEFAENVGIKFYLSKGIEKDYPVYKIVVDDEDSKAILKTVRGLREALDFAGSLVEVRENSSNVVEYSIMSDQHKVFVDNINGRPEITAGTGTNAEQLAIIADYAFDKQIYYQKPQSYEVIDRESGQPSYFADGLTEALKWAVAKQHLSNDIEIATKEKGSYYPVASLKKEGETTTLSINEMASANEIKRIESFAKIKGFQFENFYQIDNTTLSNDHKKAIADYLINWYETNMHGKAPTSQHIVLPNDQHNAFSTIKQHLEHDWNFGRRSDIQANSKGRKPINPSEAYIREWVNQNDFTKKPLSSKDYVYDIANLNRFFKDRDLYEIRDTKHEIENNVGGGVKKELPNQYQNKDTYKKRNLDFLANQIKYLGFGDGMKEALREKINNLPETFSIPILQQFYAPFVETKEAQAEVAFVLHFNKSQDSNLYFFNSYSGQLLQDSHVNQLNENHEQLFYINNGKSFTAKEAYNLLSGRSVYKELFNRDGETYNAWVRMTNDFNEKGQHNFERYTDNYGFDLAEEVSKLNLLDKSEQNTEDLFSSLKKGNIQRVEISDQNTSVVRFVDVDPKFKKLNIYDEAGNKLSIKKDKTASLKINSDNNKTISQLKR